MSATSRSSELDPELGALARAVEEGAGFPAIARAASGALGASLAVVDRSAAVLAIAAVSPEEESRLRARGSGVARRRLRVADEPVGELRLRWHQDPAGETLQAVVASLIALELLRTRSTEWADEEAAGAFVEAVLARRLTTGDEIGEQASGLGLDLGEGAGAMIGRVRPGEDARDDWREIVLAAALRGARGVSRGALGRLVEHEEGAELQVLAPVPDTEALGRGARSVVEEIVGAVGDCRLTLGHSRHAARPDELFRAGREALLACNVGEAEGTQLLAFEDTGSYRLLLSTMSENPDELEWFYEDTVAPLVAYDRQYGTDLVATVETFLQNDGNIGPTAEQMFAHRHTIRYRLGRVRDLCGYDIQSTDGRERLGFGLKVMRVLGIGPRPTAEET